MKKLIILSAILLGSCAVDRNTLTLLERPEWRSQNDTIMHNNIPVAVFTHFEYELYKGEHTIELCLSQINDTLDDINGLIKYVHTIHPSDKVQIKAMYPNSLYYQNGKVKDR